MKPTHGGARKGAGRKPSPDPLKRIDIRLSKSQIEFLKSIDPNVSKAIRTITEDKMQTQISVRQALGVDATNAFTVTVTEPYADPQVFDVHTNEIGHGLWIDGKQVEGTSQFDAGKNPASAIRRYFTQTYR